MPGLSGLELQRQLRSSQAQLPLIFLTAHGTEAMRAQTLRIARMTLAATRGTKISVSSHTVGPSLRPKASKKCRYQRFMPYCTASSRTTMATISRVTGQARLAERPRQNPEALTQNRAAS